MKVAVIMGSPRKKDSFQLCKQIEEQINNHGEHIEFDYIFLSDQHIEDCKGCCLCFQKSETVCPCTGDDLDNVKQRLFSADGVIISSPVYAYQITGQLKRFIDRMSYQFHRQVMVGKPALIVVTTDGGGSKQVYNYLKMTLSGWGLDIVGNIQIISPLYFENRVPKSIFKYNNHYFEKNHKNLILLADKYFTRIHTYQKKSPSYYDIFMFNCLRSKTYTSAVDRTYWEEKGWLENSYFYDVRLNPVKQLFGNAMRRLLHMAVSRYLKKHE
ncbi:NAD(P)H-dependent oxidoreductase [Clostridium sp. E02]|uniref:flavodoxin family protein n=1 Tax=Clostridium sp. E02 TaxID=2487134 RepID=UPI000F53F3F7|nr:NAD(P)H-dependent oxidoreductase [Clostridium sp. E02]